VKPGDPALERVETVLVGSAGTAVAAVVAEVRRQGFQAEEGGLEGEAVEAGRSLVERGRALAGSRNGADFALVLGGETTVALGSAPGSGGRNQELAPPAMPEPW
jgi:hydroxypyruvate reductase